MNAPQQNWLVGMEDEQRSRDKSQFFTPPDLATRMWRWAIELDGVTPNAFVRSVLEPAAGQGALVAPMLMEPYGCSRIVAVESDPAHCRRIRQLDKRAGGDRVEVLNRDFFDLTFERDEFDLAHENPAFEGGLMVDFPERALDFAKRCVSLSPFNIFHSEGRSKFWRHHDVTRGVRFESRPQFGGSFNPQTDFVLLELVRREVARKQGDVTCERWEWWP